MTEMYVGVMSGTSLDGIDAVLVSFESQEPVRVHHWLFERYPEEIYPTLEALFTKPQPDSPLAHQIDQILGELYADVILRLIDNFSRDNIRAIGCHGQTIIHQPDANPPFTWQAGNSEVVAQMTGIPVVHDFRSADMKVGGQGAPLAPAFHRHAFQSSLESRAVVNIGGIANATYLPASASQSVIGFDTGPGNALSDQWIREHKNLPYDAHGGWAESAKVDEGLLNHLMNDPYFQLPPPKSLDSRKFDLLWLRSQVQNYGKELDAAIIQSTIAAFTARSIARSIQMWMPDVRKVYLCGGGAHNRAIVGDLRTDSGLDVVGTNELGIPPDQVEAVAFAWLARCRILNQTANLPSVTGASKVVILGSIAKPPNSS